MNLVLCGPWDAAFTSEVAAVVRSSRVSCERDEVVRFEAVTADLDVRERVASLCDERHVDHAFVEPALRWSRFRLLAIDMDSTLITVECIDELAAYAGKKREVAAITEAAMRGEISDFAESLRRRVALLTGLPERALAETLARKVQLTHGAVELIDAAQAVGMKTMLVSGGFTYFADALRAKLRLDAAAANRLGLHDGALTGEVVGPIVDARGKASAVSTFAESHGIASSEIIAIGDGANDIPMLQLAAQSVAFHAKPIVRRVATLGIRYGGLDVLLAYLGHQVH